MYVRPALPVFCARDPKVNPELTMSDGFVDLTGEDVDILLRVATLADSPMVARNLCESRFIPCAAPAYLAQRGIPANPQVLAGHHCLGYFSASLGRSARWSFSRNGRESIHAPGGNLHLNNPEAPIDLAIDGAGIDSMLETAYAPAIRDGKRTPIPMDWQTPTLPVSVLYWPSRHLSAPVRVRVLVDFLGELFARQVPHLRPARTAYGRGG